MEITKKICLVLIDEWILTEIPLPSLECYDDVHHQMNIYERKSSVTTLEGGDYFYKKYIKYVTKNSFLEQLATESLVKIWQ